MIKKCSCWSAWLDLQLPSFQSNWLYIVSIANFGSLAIDYGVRMKLTLLSFMLLVYYRQHINAMAPIKLAKYGSVDMDFVLGVGGYDLERLLSLMLQQFSFICLSTFLNSYFVFPCSNIEIECFFLSTKKFFSTHSYFRKIMIVNISMLWLYRIDSEIHGDSSHGATHHHETGCGMSTFLCLSFSLLSLSLYLTIEACDLNRRDEWVYW